MKVEINRALTSIKIVTVIDDVMGGGRCSSTSACSAAAAVVTVFQVWHIRYIHANLFAYILVYVYPYTLSSLYIVYIIYVVFYI